MEIKKQARSRVVAATVFLLLVIPFVAFAQETNRPLGRRIVDRVFSRLCDIGVFRSARCQPSPAAAMLTLVKTVVNDNGGTATTSAFQARIDGSNVPWGVAQAISPGMHTASEVNIPGYGASSWDGDCAADGTVTLAAGENKTCAITNDDQAGRLIVDKVTVPSGSGAVFSITTTGTGAIAGGGAGTTTDAVSKEYMVSAGTYSVSEAELAGWMQVSNTCANVAIGVGETQTCTIVNHRLPRLTVTKIVVNDNGGTATSSDFTIHLRMAPGMTDVTGSPQPGRATGTTYANLFPGNYHVAETGGPGGYAMSFTGDCDASGNIALAAGEDKECTITNDDNPPQGALLITEVLYDLPNDDSKGIENRNEWVELHNGMSAGVNLAGYFIHDATGADALPGITIPAGGFVIITGTSTTESFWSIPDGVSIIVLGDTTIGAGLNNDSDAVWLENAASSTVDAVSWGDNTSAFDPAAPDVTAGHSLARIPMTTDTNSAADWTDSTSPSPGS